MIRNENMQLLPSPDSMTVAFRVESLTCKISCFASNNYQSLHCKLEPDQNMMGRWNHDDSLVVRFQYINLFNCNTTTLLNLGS